MPSCNFSLINLWCSKNLVDSQYFLGRLFDISLKTPEITLHYCIDPFDQKVQIVFVNTCGFISSARDEAHDTVQKLLKAGKTVYLLGCAVQYYKKLNADHEKINITHQWIHYLSRGDMNTVNLKQIIQWYTSKEYGNFEFYTSPRVYTNLEQKFEYLKIAEWCNNHCTFCIIPDIRGKQQSLPIEKILDEAKQMIANGIQEIILIAQDTTRYGSDLYGEPKLLKLLQRLDKLPWNFVYRLLYLYPDIVTLKHIKELKKLKKFLPYFDIPLQHISSPVLKKMGRFYDENYIVAFIDQIKKTFPKRFIRTNLIIGFPGETKKDFDKLMHFVQDTQFDNIALFEYHDEPLAASSILPNKISDKELKIRFSTIKTLVDRLSFLHSKTRKGKEEIGYITDMELLKNWNIKNIVVRPTLHCPEIDTYDTLSFDQVLWTFEQKDTLEIWDKILYKV